LGQGTRLSADIRHDKALLVKLIEKMHSRSLQKWSYNGGSLLEALSADIRHNKAPFQLESKNASIIFKKGSCNVAGSQHVLTLDKDLDQ
jgi:hypothetical protein